MHKERIVVARIETGVTSENGWIKPDGTYYPCARTEHLLKAEDIVEQMGFDFILAMDRLERLGWVKCSPPYFFDLYKPATREQLDPGMEVSLLIEHEETHNTFVRQIKRREKKLDIMEHGR